LAFSLRYDDWGYLYETVLREWLVGEVQQPWTLETITVHIEKEITPGDAVFWPDFKIILEQAGSEARHRARVLLIHL